MKEIMFFYKQKVVLLDDISRTQTRVNNIAEQHFCLSANLYEVNIDFIKSGLVC